MRLTYNLGIHQVLGRAPVKATVMESGLINMLPSRMSVEASWTRDVERAMVMRQMDFMCVEVTHVKTESDSTVM